MIKTKQEYDEIFSQIESSINIDNNGTVTTTFIPAKNERLRVWVWNNTKGDFDCKMFSKKENAIEDIKLQPFY